MSNILKEQSRGLFFTIVSHSCWEGLLHPSKCGKIAFSDGVVGRFACASGRSRLFCDVFLVTLRSHWLHKNT